MGAGVLTPSACLCQSLQVQVLGLLSLAMGLGHGPGQAQYLGLNPCLLHCLVVLEPQHRQQVLERIMKPIFSRRYVTFLTAAKPLPFGALLNPTMREHDQADCHQHVPAHMAAQT